MINAQKSAGFLQSSNEQSKKDFIKSTSFNMTSNRIKKPGNKLNQGGEKCIKLQNIVGRNERRLK